MVALVVATQEIVTDAAEEPVTSVAARQLVVPGPAEHRVLAVQAGQDIVAGRSDQPVILAEDDSGELFSVTMQHYRFVKAMSADADIRYLEVESVALILPIRIQSAEHLSINGILEAPFINGTANTVIDHYSTLVVRNNLTAPDLLLRHTQTIVSFYVRHAPIPHLNSGRGRYHGIVREPMVV